MEQLQVIYKHVHQVSLVDSRLEAEVEGVYGYIYQPEAKPRADIHLQTPKTEAEGLLSTTETLVTMLYTIYR